MAWDLRVSRRAAKVLRRTGSKDQRLLARALEQIRQSPFQGDVRRLKGEPSSLRHRAGAWRIFVQVDLEAMLIEVSAIERRTSTTYRKRS